MTPHFYPAGIYMTPYFKAFGAFGIEMGIILKHFCKIFMYYCSKICNFTVYDIPNHKTTYINSGRIFFFTIHPQNMHIVLV